MLRCSALVRAALRAPKQDGAAHVTRTLSQLSRHAPTTSSLGQLTAQTSFSARAFATKTATKTRKTPARKTTTSTRKRTTTTKKKTPAKKKPTPRRKAKPKAKAKPKKKVLTEKAKAAQEKKKALASLRELKAVALVEPKGKPDSAWTVYVSEKLQGKGGVVTENIKAASSEYKSLTASEREHYNHIANENKAANQAAYSSWVSSFTPEEIRKANNARRQLKRKTATTPKGKRSSGRGLSRIRDDRQIKRPNSAYFKFGIERRESGDFKGIPLGEAAKVITKEWNELTAGDKKKYEDLHQADKERYLREFERTYGHPSPSVKTTKA